MINYLHKERNKLGGPGQVHEGLKLVFFFSKMSNKDSLLQAVVWPQANCKRKYSTEQGDQKLNFKNMRQESK